MFSRVRRPDRRRGAVRLPAKGRGVAKDPQDRQDAGRAVRRDPGHRCQAGAIKTSQWMVAFALETEDLRMRAMQKFERKKCDLIVVNGPAAMHAADTQIEVIDARGEVLCAAAGSKRHVAKALLRVIEKRLMGGN